MPQCSNRASPTPLAGPDGCPEIRPSRPLPSRSLRAKSVAHALRQLLPIALILLLGACRSSHVRTTPDFAQNVALSGKTIVMAEPSIQLYEMQASGMLEPRADWTRAARGHFMAAVEGFLQRRNARLAPTFQPGADLPAEHRVRQLLALNWVVMGTIYTHSYLHVPLPTRGTARRKPLSWTLGPGVREIASRTGADYMLTLQINDSYSSKGRVAMMLLGVALQVALLQGGQQGGIATLVDLKTGDVVWFNVMTDQMGDMRDAEGAAATAGRLLKGLPL
ncbi:MAG: hypothetical protein IPG63_19530 [Xanthomonadales bacterium]|nr:hypothetical protein [Xanthomonadales bacterium]